jgi:hypothetical protein
MALLDSVRLEELTPSRLWSALDTETRASAARALYSKGRGVSDAARLEADLAIAHALKFRASAVRKLPLERRIAYLSRAARPDDGLAASLLLALHLETRASMLASFLDFLGIPHENGLIREDHELEPPDPSALEAAVNELFEAFPAEEVSLYLASLLAVDRETWRGLAPLLARRSGTPAAPSGLE